MKAFIDEHREVYGVEPICKVLPIAPSTYYLHAARKKEPMLLPRRQLRDTQLSEQSHRIWEANFKVYGAVKIWHQLKREGITVARCTVQRLMRTMGLQGIRRGKVIKTTFSNQSAPCPDDLVNRNFQADQPNALQQKPLTKEMEQLIQQGREAIREESYRCSDHIGISVRI